jgi:signal transduction histidine kinase
VVDRDTSQLVEIRRIILDALLWSGGAIVVLVGVLAVALSLPALRRLRETQTASEAIAAGEFTVRLPVRKSRDELDELARIVNAMMDEIERLVAEARTVGEGIAHELRTPLTRLRTSLEHAADLLGPDDPRTPLLETCIAETDALLSRFRALLRIAAVEARARRTGIKEISFSDIVTQVVELFEPVAGHVDVDLSADIDEGVLIRGDGELLFEAISNLLDNAIKFSPPKTCVRVALSGGAHGPALSVSDQGPGIQVKDRSYVTRRFYRSLQAAAVPGHGLGLSLVAAVAALHGFSLSFEDASPGTTVRLALDPVWTGPAPSFAPH